MDPASGRCLPASAHLRWENVAVR
uniref:Uncharacterized protein n=1 Tax=Arundo donax TaxID=35708 RepID=A0A0A9BHQ1_ARUDO